MPETRCAMHTSPDSLMLGIACAEAEALEARKTYGRDSDEYREAADRVTRLRDLLSEAQEREL